MSSFEYIKDSKKTVLTPELAKKLADEITAKYKTLDTKRNPQKEDAKTLQEMLDRDAIKEIKYNETVSTDDIYELKESLRANLRQYLNNNLENFVVQGRDKRSHQNAPSQKEYLVYNLRDMDFKTEAKQVVDNFLIWGELITFTSWKVKINEYRRPINQIQADYLKLQTKIQAGEELDEIEQENYLRIEMAVNDGKSHVILINKEYEGAKIEAINPEFFVYDTYCSDFDSAFKADKKPTTYDNIITEKNFKLDEEAHKALNPQMSETDPTEKENSEEDNKNTGRVELIQVFGDIKLDDGTLLRNYFVVIANEKHVIRFEPNPYLINPYTCEAVIRDHRTKRGRSLLKVSIPHSLVSSYIMTKMLQILALVQNPPWYGKKGTFKNSGEKEIGPGVFLEHDDDLTPDQRPQPMTHYAQALDPSFAFLEKFKAMMQALTGIFPYMSGIQDDTDRTLGEANILMNGQQVRLMMVIDDIQDFLLKNISKVAKILSDYKFGQEILPKYKDNGDFEETEITDEIRQGNYKFDYTDRRSHFEKRQESDKFVAGVQGFVNSGADVNINETYKSWLDTWSFKDIERFINSHPLDKMLDSLPPEIETPSGMVSKDQIKEDLAGQLDQFMQALQGAMNEPTGNPALAGMQGDQGSIQPPVL
jgi:hypothetical protein